MEYVTVGDEQVLIAAKSKGKLNNKFNRAIKLAVQYDSLMDKLYGIAERGIDKCSPHSIQAIACILMATTGIRVGNEGSAEGYMTVPHPRVKDKKPPEFVQTYGLTTLKPDHVEIKRGKAVLAFSGKKQVHNTFTIKCPTLTKWLKHLKAQKGDTLLMGITDYELRKFIKKYVGSAYSPKDFRTMRANIAAGVYVNQMEVVHTKKELNEQLRGLYVFVSQQLHNTPGVCKSSYVSDRLPLYIVDNYYTPKR